MRDRSPYPWWPSEASAIPNNYQPIDVPWQVSFYWACRVKDWICSINIIDDLGNGLVGGGVFGWNINNVFGSSSTSAGSPSSEAHLGTGWGIQQFGFYDATPTLRGFISLFDPQLSTSGAASGRGMEYTIPANITLPYLNMVFDNLISSRTGTSSAVVTFDGITVPMADTGGRTYTGTITIVPNSFWEYKRADNTHAIYNPTTGAVILAGRQTDELP